MGPAGACERPVARNACLRFLITAAYSKRQIRCRRHQILGPTSAQLAASCPKYLRRAVMLKSPTRYWHRASRPLTRPGDFPNFGALDVATIVLCWTEGIELGILQCIIACTIRRVPARWRRISCWRRLVNRTSLSWFPRVAVLAERVQQVPPGWRRTPKGEFRLSLACPVGLAVRTTC